MNIIKVVRKKVNLTQEEFAYLFNFSRDQIRDYETGRSPTPAELENYLKAELEKLNKPKKQKKVKL